ncbi:MAG: hypothetical protein KC502_21310 [Myxococcales bacterium]|nr:hypothetical protein [Myxococcales bacterium]
MRTFSCSPHLAWALAMSLTAIAAGCGDDSPQESAHDVTALDVMADATLLADGAADSGQEDVSIGDGMPSADAGQEDVSIEDGMPSADADQEDISIDGTTSADGEILCEKDVDCAPLASSCVTVACGDAGTCVSTQLAEGAKCTDGDACTPSDGCGADGVCLPGKVTDCDDNNPCTTDTCDKDKGCQHISGGADCTDGDACTEGDACSNGLCVAGPVKVCDDANPCTDDSCDKTVGCASVDNTTDCDDGDKCSEGDTCGDGKCVSGEAKDCDDKNPCTTESCDKVKGCVFTEVTNACDDGNACTSGDACKNGKCVGQGLQCDDNNDCTTDSCALSTGCTHTNNTVDCSDGSVCTLGDKCGDGKCVSGEAKSCDDDNPCTTDACDKLKGCSNTFNTADCTDGNACTDKDTCEGGQCKGTSKVCDDKNACTTDSCDKVKGCVFGHLTKVCDDGNACTSGDACKSGKCVGQGLQCDDNNACTTDSCALGKGCSYTNNTVDCSDGSACTLGDKCGDGKCVSGSAKNCDDKNVCTTDSCDKVKGCISTNNTEPCSDGSACTLKDACASGKCESGPKVNCSDGNSCTTDSCHPLKKGCVFTHTTAPCSDGNACTLNDKCGAGKCEAGSAKSCDDANACTADSCDAKTGQCANKPIPGCCKVDGDCNDFNLCTTDKCAKSKCTAAPTNDGMVCATGKLCGSGTCVAPAKGWAKKLAANGYGRFFCALLNSGKVACWGANNQGQIGNGTGGYSGSKVTKPTKVVGIDKAIDVGAGYDHACAVKSDGTVWCWGDNSEYNLGNGTNKDAKKPVLLKGVTGATAVACGDGFTCVLTKLGEVWCLGTRYQGEVGDGTVGNFIDIKVPTKIKDFGEVIALDSGEEHICALTKQRKVYCWGSNYDAETADLTTTRIGTPTLRSDVANGVSVGMGGATSCAADTDGKAFCWGRNDYGQTGSGTKGEDVRKAVQVQGFAGAIALAGGVFHGVGLTMQGTAMTWGRNYNGQLADGSKTDRLLPSTVYQPTKLIQVEANSYATCLLRQDGGVWCAGQNGHGQLGNGTTSTSTVLTPVLSGACTANSQCDDGNLCTKDICDTKTGNCLKPSSTSTCDDNNPCTDDPCDPLKGCGKKLFNNKPCDDGTVCTAKDACNDLGKCAGVKVKCDDSDSCTTDSCDAKLGCAHKAIPNCFPPCKSDVDCEYDSGCSTPNCVDNKCKNKNVNEGLVCATGQVCATGKCTAPGTGWAKKLAGNSYGNFFCALLNSGKVACWGDNTQGQIGNGKAGSGQVALTPSVVPKLDNVIDVATGANHTCVVKLNGTVWCWGDGFLFQLGNGGQQDSRKPVQFKGVTGATAVAAGDRFTCALTSTGTVWCAGDNRFGACGDGTVDGFYVKTPKQVKGLSDVVALDAGEGQVCARRSDNKVLCWGSNYDKESVQGSAKKYGTPTLRTDLGAMRSLGLGAAHSCATSTGGKAFCWGYNYYGGVGNGTQGSDVAKAAEVVNFAAGVQIAGGFYHTVGLRSDGTAMSWGRNNTGQLGDGSKTSRNKPGAVGHLTKVTQVEANRFATCLLRQDGGVWCAGRNDYGQLGNGTKGSSLIGNAPLPVKTGTCTSNAMCDDGNACTKDVCSLTSGNCTITKISCEDDNVCTDDPCLPESGCGKKIFTTKPCSDGTLCTLSDKCDGAGKCAGASLNCDDGDQCTVDSCDTKLGCLHKVTATCSCKVDGDCNDGNYCTAETCSSGKCVFNNTHNKRVCGEASTCGAGVCSLMGTGWGSKLFAGGTSEHFCATRPDKSLWCWGRNSDGQIGNGNTKHAPVPYKVAAAGAVIDVAVGAGHTCAVKTDKTLACWGRNTSGAVGTGTKTSSDVLTPQVVKGVGAVVKVVAGADFTCALRLDQTVWCWGLNGDAQLGRGYKGGSQVHPAEVPGLGGVVDLDAGYAHVCALDTAGVMSCWGRNVYRQSAPAGSTGLDVLKPTPVTLMSNISAIKIGRNTTCGLNNLGKLKCFGDNSNRQRGDPLSIPNLNDKKVSTAKLPTVADAEMGGDHGVAVTPTGVVYAWGANQVGQLGVGKKTKDDYATPVKVATGVVQVEASGSNTCLLRNNGSVACTGYGYYGALGNGTVGKSTTKASFGQVVGTLIK